MILRKENETRLQGTKVILRAKNLSDALNDFDWATDLELMRLDAGKPYPFDYSEYLARYPQGLDTPNKIQFAIESREGEHIGNCTCYNIDKNHKEAEIGIMIGKRECWGKGYGSDALKTLMRHAFGELAMERLFLHTLELNTRAFECFKRCGFGECGRMVIQGQKFIKMETFLLKPAL